MFTGSGGRAGAAQGDWVSQEISGQVSQKKPCLNKDLKEEDKSAWEREGKTLPGSGHAQA